MSNSTHETNLHKRASPSFIETSDLSAAAQSDRENDKNWSTWEHIVWVNVVYFIPLHLGALYGAYLAVTVATWTTCLFAFFLLSLGMFGITAGAHRLWSHKAYKAKLPLRVLLAIGNSVAYQNSIFEWARDHRVHHKYAETDADPHNSKRGFFFSHIGWLCCSKHPDVKKMGSKIDLSDLLNDPVVYYQNMFYIPSMILCCFVLPTVIPWHFWGESIWNSFFVAAIFRYCYNLNITFLVNSAAHMYGNRPYDKTIAGTENMTVAALAFGEGYHNFHHAFPCDYSTSEWGWSLNSTTVFLDILGKFGLAYDMRRVSQELIKSRMSRTGGGNVKECQM